MKRPNSIFRLSTLIFVVLALTLVAWGLASCYSSSGGGFDTSCKHVRVENCVCQACNQEVHKNLTYIEAQNSTCTDIGINSNVYVCEDCERGFYDKKGRKEVDYDTIVQDAMQIAILREILGQMIIPICPMKIRQTSHLKHGLRL